MSTEPIRDIHIQMTRRDIVIAVIAVALVVSVGPWLLSHITPFDAVITGINDQNLAEVSGKSVSTASDGVQKVAMVDDKGAVIQSSRDLCDGNDLKTFNTSSNSTAIIPLIPPTNGQTISVCSIHVHSNTANPEVYNILEGGGANCATMPMALDGDLTPAKGLRLPGMGHDYLGGAGATIYKNSAPNLGICAQTAGANMVRFSGTYFKQ